MTNEALISSLREYAEWAEANIWEVPINLPDVLNRAAEVIEAATNPMGIEELGLSVRAYNGLYRWNLRLVREVAKLNEDELLKVPGIGRGTAKEIMEKIREVYGR